MENNIEETDVEEDKTEQKMDIRRYAPISNEEYLEKRKVVERYEYITEKYSIDKIPVVEFEDMIRNKIRKLIKDEEISPDLKQDYQLRFVPCRDEDDIVTVYLVYDSWETKDEVEREILRKEMIDENAVRNLKMLINNNKEAAVEYIKELGLV